MVIQLAQLPLVRMPWMTVADDGDNVYVVNTKSYQQLAGMMAHREWRSHVRPWNLTSVYIINERRMPYHAVNHWDPSLLSIRTGDVRCKSGT